MKQNNAKVLQQKSKNVATVSQSEKVKKQDNIKVCEVATTGDTDDESENMKTNTPSPFARNGNKNAVGNKGGLGGPPRNKNAVKTHEYETFYYQDLSEEERAFLKLSECFNDKYFQQQMLIQDLTLREYKIKKTIKEVENTPGGMVYDSVSKVKGKLSRRYKDSEKKDEKKDAKESYSKDDADASSDMVQTQDNSSHVAKPVLKRVMELEESLTRVQARKQQAISQLHKMEVDDTRLSIDIDKFEKECEKEIAKSNEAGSSTSDHSIAMSKVDSILDIDDPAVKSLYTRLFDGYNESNDNFENN